MVGLFLALLELVRNRRVRVVQDRIEGLISVQLRDDPEDPGHDQPAPPADPDATE
jgi:chromatin segregation and condensation protein Rec8/ScpA/Scc1 (kleisin family)